MNDDELPEIFDELRSGSAAPGLRERVLTAVDSELRRHRKPRWERALEWSVAATFVLSVGLNVWQMAERPRPHSKLKAPLLAEEEPASKDLIASRHSESKLQNERLRHLGPLDEGYSQFLVELLNPAG